MGRSALRLDQINEEHEFYKDSNVHFSSAFANGVKILKKFVGIFFFIEKQNKKIYKQNIKSICFRLSSCSVRNTYSILTKSVEKGG